jgi:hypothetical protein
MGFSSEEISWDRDDWSASWWYQAAAARRAAVKAAMQKIQAPLLFTFEKHFNFLRKPICGRLTDFLHFTTDQ